MDEIIVTRKRDLQAMIHEAVRIAMEESNAAIGNLKDELSLNKMWLKEKAAAEYLGMAKKTLADKRRAGEIDGKRSGRSYIYAKDVLDAYLENL
jgi:hypothetical protein